MEGAEVEALVGVLLLFTTTAPVVVVANVAGIVAGVVVGVVVLMAALLLG